MESQSLKSANESAVGRELGEVSVAAGRLAKVQEAGQAKTPLSDAFDRLNAPLFGDPVHAILLGFTPEDTAMAVSALVGQEYNICRVIVLSRIGFTEVLLQERGFSLDTGSEVREFDQADQFIAALESEDLLQDGNPSSWMDPLRLQLPAPSRRRGIRLLIPESLNSLIKKPALLSTLSDQADWLFLCGEAEQVLTSDSRDTLQLLIDQMVGLQCLVSSPEGKPALGSLPAKGWWLGWKVVCSLSPLRLTSGSEAVDARLALLTQPDSELRRFVQETRRQRELESGLELLAIETEQAKRHLQNQRKLQNSGLIASKGQDLSLRKAVDQSKERLQEEIDAMRRSLEEQSKRLLVPGGLAYQKMEELAASIDTDHIHQENADTVIKLSLDEGCRTHLVHQIETYGHHRTVEDLSTVQEAMDVAGENLRKLLADSAGITFKPSFPSLDEKKIWSSITGLARPEIRYRGEMPKPGIGARLGKARQGIFGVMMLGMILGAIATLLGEQNNLRTYLYAAMLPLLIIGFFWTYVSVRKQQRQVIQKELDKLREGTARELRRVIADLFREEQNVIGQYLQKVSRTITSELAEQVQSRETQLQQDRERSTHVVREQEKSLDQRLRQMDSRFQEQEKLRSKIPSIREGLEQWLRDWVSRFNQKKA